MECGLFMGRENEGWRPDTLVGPVFMGKELRRIVTRYKLCWLYSGVTVLVRCRKRLDKAFLFPPTTPFNKPQVMKLNKSSSNQSLLSLRRSVLKNKPTKSELRIRDLLDELNERYCFQKGFFSERSHFIVDFYLPKRKKLCLEVDGGYHDSEEQMAYDARRTRFLEDVRGFRVLRLSNYEAQIISRTELLQLISA